MTDTINIPDLYAMLNEVDAPLVNRAYLTLHSAGVRLTLCEQHDQSVPPSARVAAFIEWGVVPELIQLLAGQYTEYQKRLADEPIPAPVPPPVPPAEPAPEANHNWWNRTRGEQ